jgi:hypothetical protein
MIFVPIWKRRRLKLKCFYETKVDLESVERGIGNAPISQAAFKSVQGDRIGRNFTLWEIIIQTYLKRSICIFMAFLKVTYSKPILWPIMWQTVVNDGRVWEVFLSLLTTFGHFWSL